MPDGLWPDELTETLAVGAPVARAREAGMEITIYNPTFDTPERSHRARLGQCPGGRSLSLNTLIVAEALSGHSR